MYAHVVNILKLKKRTTHTLEHILIYINSLRKNVFQRQSIKLTPFPLLLGFARNDDHNVEFIIFKFCEGGLSYLTQFLLIMVVICNGATKYQTHFTWYTEMINSFAHPCAFIIYIQCTFCTPQNFPMTRTSYICLSKVLYQSDKIFTIFRWAAFLLLLLVLNSSHNIFI